MQKSRVAPKKNISLSFQIAIQQNGVECKFSAAAPNCEYVFAKREENERTADDDDCAKFAKLRTMQKCVKVKTS